MATVKRTAWATYQGLRASNAEYTIRGDLAPDDGWVEFDSEIVDTSQLKLEKIPLIPFAQEFQPPLTRPVHIMYFSAGAGATVARRKTPTPSLNLAKNFKGLQTFGQLRISSEQGKEPIAVDHVYIHRDSAHDVGRKGQDGKNFFLQGRTRLRLTDGRDFWPDYGECYGYVNVPLSSTAGKTKFDPFSAQPEGEPYPLDVVMDWLFYHLPGSPIVNDIKEATSAFKDKPPIKIVRKFQPPYPELARLMQQYGLSISRERSGAYTLWRRGAVKVVVLKAETITSARSLEIKYPPPATRIFGGNIRRNQHRFGLPVSRDLDGRLYPLYEVIARYTSMAYALKQMAGAGQRQYEALPNDDIRKIAREDWGKLFQLSTVVGYDGTGPVLDLPMHNPMIAVKGGSVQTKSVQQAGQIDQVLAPPETSILADGSRRQEVREIPIVVIGNAFGQRLMDTTEEPTLTVAEAFAAASRERKAEIIKSLFNVEIGRLGRRRFGNNLRLYLDILRTDYGDLVRKKEKEHERLQIELNDVRATFNQVISDGNRWQVRVGMATALAENVLILQARLLALSAAVSEKKRELSALRAEFKKIEDIFAKIKERKDLTPEDRFWMNLGEIEFSPDAYRIDRRLGTITMNTPVGLISPPLTLNREHLSLIALPTLNVFYSIEHNTRTPADHYSLLAIRSAPGVTRFERTTGRWPHPAEISAGRQFPVKGSSLPVIPKEHPEIILYVDHNGDEFNGLTCDDLAIARAGEYLSGDVQQVEGMTFTYEGWVAPPSMKGVDSVTWSNAGDKPVTSVAYSSRYHKAGDGVDSPAKASDARTISVLAAKGDFRVSP